MVKSIAGKKIKSVQELFNEVNTARNIKCMFVDVQGIIPELDGLKIIMRG